jgi:outer membrane protein assembly factor BamA
MMKNIVFSLIIPLLLTTNIFAQQDGATSEIRNDENATVDSTKKSEKIKSGFNFGALPAVSFDSDLGFQYGLIGNLFNYGDGSYYPEYKWSLYGEWSRTTKGTGTNQLFFDSKYLLPYGLRITADLSFLTEKALDFYGFNGFEAAYHPEFEEDEGDDTDQYISRMYYRHERKIARFSLDFQGAISGKKLRWLAGFARFDNKIATVDIEQLNKGLDDDEKLPDVETLYDKYVDYGFISEEERDGGAINALKLGVVYDTRDNEPNPNTGFWVEAIAMTAPAFLGNSESAYTKLALIYRHYVPILYDKLTLAYRLGWQGTVDGDAPFYIQPYMITTNTKVTKSDGLGGAKSLRGVLRNRVVGDAFTYANLELRYKFLKVSKWNQNFYFALSGFGDFGTITDRIDIHRDLLPVGETYSDFFDAKEDKFHSAFGAGLHIAMNQNFILAIDYGLAGDERDGKSGMYINIGFLF